MTPTKCAIASPTKYETIRHFEVKRVSVTRLHSIIFRPTADDLAQWGEQWKKSLRLENRNQKSRLLIPRRDIQKVARRRVRTHGVPVRYKSVL